MTGQKWLTHKGRSLALIGAGAAAGCLVEAWLHVLVENNAYFEPGRVRLGAPFQDGLVISQCVAASDCDIAQSFQHPAAVAANYLLTAVAFAVLARSTAVGGLVAAIVGGVILSVVMTRLEYAPTIPVEILRSPAIVWVVVILGSAVSSIGWLFMRRGIFATTRRKVSRAELSDRRAESHR